MTTAPVSAFATGVSFQSSKLPGYELGVPTEEVHGLFAKPDGKGPFPAVVLLHTCGGVTPHVSQDWPAFLAEIGYAVLTVDTFGSRNAGRCPAARYLGVIPSSDGITAMKQDAYGALDYLAGRPDIDPDRTGVMGFSLGAFSVERFAENNYQSVGGGNFKAGISVYGRCMLFKKNSFPTL